MYNLWTVQDWQHAYQNNNIQLSDLSEYVAGMNNDDHAWISIATAAKLQAQIKAMHLKMQQISVISVAGANL